jgi:hypothetical protein
LFLPFLLFICFALFFFVNWFISFFPYTDT